MARPVMAKPKPKYHQIDMDKALRAAQKLGGYVRVENGVLMVLPVDSGDKPNNSVEAQEDVELL